jgi:RNA polymerase subunit RPABC4/transcription elongation factor Spt4
MLHAIMPETLLATLCPECGAANMAPDESGALHCLQCGTIVPVVQLSCPACGSEIGADTDACPECGEPVSLFGQVMARHTDSRRSPLWLEQARGQAQGVRREEELASQKRYETLQETDRRRLEAVEREELVQQHKDRLTLRWGLAIAAALALLFLGLALLSILR